MKTPSNIKFPKAVAVAMVAITVTACSSSQPPDPREGGFFTGVVGLSTGGYQQRIDAKQQKLDESQVKQDELIQRANAVRAEREAVAKQLRMSRFRLTSLEKDVAALQEQLRIGQNATFADMKKLAEAEALIANADEKLSGGAGSDSPSMHSSEDVKEIEASLDSVAAIVSELSGSK